VIFLKLALAQKGLFSALQIITGTLQPLQFCVIIYTPLFIVFCNVIAYTNIINGCYNLNHGAGYTSYILTLIFLGNSCYSRVDAPLCDRPKSYKLINSLIFFHLFKCLG
jgi:hypothetical protein